MYMSHTDFLLPRAAGGEAAGERARDFGGAEPTPSCARSHSSAAAHRQRDGPGVKHAPTERKV